MIIRVILLLAGLVGLTYSFNVKNYQILVIFLVFVILQIFYLIRFLNQRNDELTKFIEAIQYRDFTQSFNEKNAPVSVRNLRRAFNTVNHMFKSLSIEKEAQHQYLRKILEIVDTGILSYDNTDEVKWMNEALKKILDIPYLKNIKSLELRNPTLFAEMQTLQPGENTITRIANKQYQLIKSSFKEGDRLSELIVFQNISEAIDETENLAWQKLLRVLTHEIMNSITPIASLADTLQLRLKQKDEHVEEDLSQGMEVIKSRSEGLLRFANVYRNFSKINEANFSLVFVRDIIHNIEILMESSLQEKNIQFEVVLKNPHLQIKADQSLIEQVLINLIVNAIEAVKEVPNPLITFTAYSSAEGKAIFELSDNGEGMSDEVMEQIFVPFFTTKKFGSGIGLSLSKQIMTLHKGSLTVKSKQGKGSIFYLEI
jgi:nitrogen fixation/metabolism regulation signal transduction histidine kinase